MICDSLKKYVDRNPLIISAVEKYSSCRERSKENNSGGFKRECTLLMSSNHFQRRKANRQN